MKNDDKVISKIKVSGKDVSMILSGNLIIFIRDNDDKFAFRCENGVNPKEVFAMFYEAFNKLEGGK